MRKNHEKIIGKSWEHLWEHVWIWMDGVGTMWETDGIIEHWIQGSLGDLFFRWATVLWERITSLENDGYWEDHSKIGLVGCVPKLPFSMGKW
jgi:hypothetical protein